MINLLPPEQQKHSYHEYQLRIAAMSILFVALLGTASGIVLVPSYLSLRTDVLAAQTALAEKQQDVKSEDANNVEVAKNLMAKESILKDRLKELQRILKKPTR